MRNQYTDIAMGMRNIANARTKLNGLWHITLFSQAKLCLIPSAGGVSSLSTVRNGWSYPYENLIHLLSKCLKRTYVTESYGTNETWSSWGSHISERRQDNKQRRKERREAEEQSSDLLSKVKNWDPIWELKGDMSCKDLDDSKWGLASHFLDSCTLLSVRDLTLQHSLHIWWNWEERDVSEVTLRIPYTGTFLFIC